MSYAIRFLPADPRDASPALYLAASDDSSVRLASSPSDRLAALCDVPRPLRVAALNVALADLATGPHCDDPAVPEHRPRSRAIAWALCSSKARHAGRRR